MTVVLLTPANATLFKKNLESIGLISRVWKRIDTLNSKRIRASMVLFWSVAVYRVQSDSDDWRLIPPFPGRFHIVRSEFKILCSLWSKILDLSRYGIPTMIDRIEKSPEASNLTKWRGESRNRESLVRCTSRSGLEAGENSLGTCQRENHFWDCVRRGISENNPRTRARPRSHTNEVVKCV